MAWPHTLNPREHEYEHSLGYLPIVYTCHDGAVSVCCFGYNFRYTQINRQLSRTIDINSRSGEYFKAITSTPFAGIVMWCIMPCVFNIISFVVPLVWNIFCENTPEIIELRITNGGGGGVALHVFANGH